MSCLSNTTCSSGYSFSWKRVYKWCLILLILSWQYSDIRNYDSYSSRLDIKTKINCRNACINYQARLFSGIGWVSPLLLSWMSYKSQSTKENHPLNLCSLIQGRNSMIWRTNITNLPVTIFIDKDPSIALERLSSFKNISLHKKVLFSVCEVDDSFRMCLFTNVAQLSFPWGSMSRHTK